MTPILHQPGPLLCEGPCPNPLTTRAHARLGLVSWIRPSSRARCSMSPCGARKRGSTTRPAPHAAEPPSDARRCAPDKQRKAPCEPATVADTLADSTVNLYVLFGRACRGRTCRTAQVCCRSPRTNGSLRPSSTSLWNGRHRHPSIGMISGQLAVHARATAPSQVCHHFHKEMNAAAHGATHILTRNEASQLATRLRLSNGGLGGETPPNENRRPRKQETALSYNSAWA